MNIICYVNKLNDGGAERVMSILSGGLAQRGHEVTLVTDYSMPNEYPVNEKVKRVVLDGEMDSQKKGNMKQSLRRIPKLRKICKQERADIIVSFISNASFRAILATRCLRTKNLISVRSNPRMVYSSKKMAALVRTLYPLAEGCVFQTEEARSWFSAKIQKKSRIILNPISDVFFNVTPQPMQEKRVVTCGRLERQKRTDLLIDAFHKVCDDFPEYKLEIYGVGPLNEQLQTQINNLGRQDRIALMGRCEDVPNTIKNASLFVLSSDHEGLPNALMEAMVLNLPVVATDCGGGGARSLLADGEDGFLVPRGDVDALAEAVRKSLADPDAAKLRGEKAGEKAKGFSTEKIVDKWEAYIRQIVDGVR